MSRHDVLKGEEAVGAGRAAARGAGLGAAKWGLAMALLGTTGYFISPIYRGLTIQFKTYIQMSGMVMGGMIGADNHLRQYEADVRLQRKTLRNQAIWAEYEREFAEEAEGQAAAARDQKDGNQK